MNEKYMVLVLGGLTGWTVIMQLSGHKDHLWGWGETLEHGSYLWPVSFLV